jgi:hypothetical protein
MYVIGGKGVGESDGERSRLRKYTRGCERKERPRGHDQRPGVKYYLIRQYSLSYFAGPFVYGFSSIFMLALQRVSLVICPDRLIGPVRATLVVSFFGLRQVRLPLVFGSLATGVFWAMVGVL